MDIGTLSPVHKIDLEFSVDAMLRNVRHCGRGKLANVNEKKIRLQTQKEEWALKGATL